MKRQLMSLVGLSILLLASVAQAGPVDINTADAETLAAELVGIGPALAQAIVEDRAKNGRFASPEDLARVSGVGMRIVENNREFILVSEN
jgi:competence protein ComEA